MSDETNELYEDEKWPGESFLEAAKLKCHAQIKEAEAKIGLYLVSPMGVGDHPNIMEEILKAAEEGSQAQDVLDFLEKNW